MGQQDPKECVEILCHACFLDVVLIFKQTKEETVTNFLVFVVRFGHLRFQAQVYHERKDKDTGINQTNIQTMYTFLNP